MKDYTSGEEVILQEHELQQLQRRLEPEPVQQHLQNMKFDSNL